MNSTSLLMLSVTFSVVENNRNTHSTLTFQFHSVNWPVFNVLDLLVLFCQCLVSYPAKINKKEEKK